MNGTADAVNIYKYNRYKEINNQSINQSIKIFKNLYKLTVRRLQAHEIYPAYEFTPLHLLDGRLKHFERSAAIKTLSQYITDHLDILLQHILHTDPDEMWMEKYDNSVELFSRMCKALERFVSLKHPQTCV